MNLFFTTAISISLLCPPELFSQTDSAHSHSITVHFLYGSKPKRNCKASEEKCFGGIHGGHVSIEDDSCIFSFQPKYGWHIFASRRHRLGGFIAEDKSSFHKDTCGDQYTSIVIPLSDSQYVAYKKLKAVFLGKSPYDYAFFGVRCAAGAADVLSHLGILKERSVFGDVCHNFYPQRLRRKLIRYAKKNNCTIIRHCGRATRKWERE